MSRWLRWAAKLYPKAWRERYGRELDALLEDAGPVPGDLFNVVAEALKMQLTNWKAWRQVALIIFAGAFAALLVSYQIPDQWRSGVVLRLKPNGPAGLSPLDASRALESVRDKTLSRVSLVKLVREYGLYPDVTQKQTLEDAVDRMQRDVRFSFLAGPSRPDASLASLAFKMDFTYRDRLLAKRVVANLTSQLVLDTPTAQSTASVEILDPPNFPYRPISPNRLTIVLAGAALGLVIGFLVSRLRRRSPAA